MTRKCVICKSRPIRDGRSSTCSAQCQAERVKLYASSKSHPHVCVECGAWFYGMKESKTCSRQCRGLMKARQEGLTPKKERRCTCLGCGKEYQPKDLKRDKYCGRECFFRHTSSGKKTKRNLDNNLRKAKKLGCAHEPIKRQEIFARDGHRCQICGKKTTTRKGYPSDLYPTIDHITPLSLGGTHTKDNVQCACFKCNTAKRHTGKGDQMLLYG